jgi:acyl carrier protein
LQGKIFVYLGYIPIYLQDCVSLLLRKQVGGIAMIEEIREILKNHAKLATDASSLGAESDLYQAGMTSLASVNVMLALEGHFDVEFPDRLLKRSVFESIAAIKNAIEEIKELG